MQQHYLYHFVTEIYTLASSFHQTSKFKSFYIKQVNNTISAHAQSYWPISSLRDCLRTYNLSVNMQSGHASVNTQTGNASVSMQTGDASANMRSGNVVYSPRYNVDPAGDLILLVGKEENQRPIRVSSKVLSLASPVFITMFGPRYFEGHVLPNQARLSIPSFPFPEEDPETMTWFCRALHLKSNADETKVTVGLIFNIAALCDRYDASAALGGWSRFWMEKLANSLLRITTLHLHTPIR